MQSYQKKSIRENKFLHQKTKNGNFFGYFHYTEDIDAMMMGGSVQLQIVGSECFSEATKNEREFRNGRDKDNEEELIDSLDVFENFDNEPDL